MVKVLRLLTIPLLLIGMLTLAGLVADRVYTGQLLAQLAAGAAAGSVLISLCCLRLPAWIVAPISTVALACYLGFAIWFTAARAGIPGELATVGLEALRDGIPRLLAVLVPIEPQPDTVALPILTVWLAGLAASELAMRAGRALTGFVAPVLTYAGALWLAGPDGAGAMWLTAGFAALLVAALAVTGRVRSDESSADRQTVTALRLRTMAAAATAVLLILGLAAATAPALTAQVTRQPIDPRSLVEPPQLDALDQNPLIRLSGWALRPDQPLLQVKADADTRIRLAVLSDYDGVTWRVGATYRPAGRALPAITCAADCLPAAGDRRGVPRETVRQEITVGELTGKLLPAAATPRRIDGVRVAFDLTTGTVLRPGGLQPGVSYTVTSYQDRPDPALLPTANVPDAAEMARYLALGDGIPVEMQRLADKISNENAAPYQRAVAIEKFLAEHYRLDPQAASGHAYPNLNFFLFTDPLAGGRKGTSEQFSAAYAVLARLVNLPSRVVVGFPVTAGDSTVTAGDALAWPEVYFTGLGWVAFHPLPQTNSPRPLEDDYRPEPEPSQSSEPEEPEIPTLSPAEKAPPPATSSAAAAPADDRSIAVIAGAGGGGLLLLFAVFLLVVLVGRAQLRRNRLDRGAPADRISGAWLELRDALRLAGQPAPAHMSAAETSEHAAAAAALIRGRHTVRLAAPPIDELAGLVNEAAFSPEAADPGQAQTARVKVLHYIGELKARRGWWQRLRWTLHPGPLRWRR